MAGRDLISLLDSQAEPSQRVYNDTVKAAIQDSQKLSTLNEEKLSLHLATDSSRFVRFFELLHTHVLKLAPAAAHEVAAQTSEFLIRVVPELNELLDADVMIQILTPTLSICLTPSQPLGLRKLAGVLTICPKLLEKLISHSHTSSSMQRWVSLPTTVAFDQATQYTWLARFSQMILSCSGNHDVASAIHRWKELDALLTTLRILNSKVPFQAPSAGDLNENLKAQLKLFELKIPGSQRVVQKHIHDLENRETNQLLRHIVVSFPCKLCIAGLQTLPQAKVIELQNVPEAFETGNDFDLDILGHRIGSWKMIISPPALRDIQALRRQNIFAPVEARLRELASGHLIGSLAGPEDKRRQLKVPLTQAKCGHQNFILWEMSLQPDSTSQHQDQVIAIWKVGNQAEILKALDRVILLQQDYSSEWIRRCCQRPEAVGGPILPMSFEPNHLQDITPRNSTHKLDTRMVDPETIEMAYKFHPLTKPLIHSIMNNNLAAEFPFDLSSDEAHCIKHFKTATLILGRSGTGKTTCLTLKLIGKFLAATTAPAMRPAHQVSRSQSLEL